MHQTLPRCCELCRMWWMNQSEEAARVNPTDAADWKKGGWSSHIWDIYWWKYQLPKVGACSYIKTEMKCKSGWEKNNILYSSFSYSLCSFSSSLKPTDERRVHRVKVDLIEPPHKEALCCFQWHKHAALPTKKDQMCSELKQQAHRRTSISIFPFWSAEAPARQKESAQTHSLRLSTAVDRWRLTVWLCNCGRSSGCLVDYGPFPQGSLHSSLPVNAAFQPQTESSGWAVGFWM